MNDTIKRISEIIYNHIDYMYCDNCRYHGEIDWDKQFEILGYRPCQDCHRKYNGWGISRSEADDIAEKIAEIFK